MSESPGVKLGATKGKLILVSVLAVTLIAVVVKNFGGGADVPLDETSSGAPTQQNDVVESTPAPAAPAAAPLAEARAAADDRGPFGEFAVDVPWPTITLEEMIEIDPLAVPAWAGPPPPSDVATGRQFSEDQLKELQSAENAIIFVSGDKRVALIGSQEFQVGDMIGGMKISDISSAGIVLSDPEQVSSE